MNNKLFSKYDLNEQLSITRKAEERKMGDVLGHVIDDWNRLDYRVKFVNNSSVSMDIESKKTEASNAKKIQEVTNTLDDTSMAHAFPSKNPLVAVNLLKGKKAQKIHKIH